MAGQRTLLSTENTTVVPPASGLTVGDYIEATRILKRILVALDAVSLFCVLTILVLSTAPTKNKIHLSPKIFTIHLMFVNVVHCVCSLFGDLIFVVDDGSVTAWYSSIFGPFYLTMQQLSIHVLSFTFLIFNCSMVPMMVMSILACHYPKSFTGNTAAKYFSALIVLSDLVPLVYSLVKVPLMGISVIHIVSRQLDYTVVCYVLYVAQLLSTVAAILVLRAKSNRLALVHAGTAASQASRRNLRHVLLFSIGPSMVQVPFAIRQLWNLVEVEDSDAAQFVSLITYDVVRVIFALKPTVDALFALTFLGEYRQHASRFIAGIRRLSEKFTSTGHQSSGVAPYASAFATITPSRTDNAASFVSTNN